MARNSPFTITPAEASLQVSQRHNLLDENKQYFLIQISFQPLYANNPLPQSVYKKLPRLINGIPLGAGKLSQSQARNIHWKYIESTNKEMHSFLSSPITIDEADEDRRVLRDNLIRQSKAVFGDVTVKMSIVLSICLKFESDYYINDIADSHEEGLQFFD